MASATSPVQYGSYSYAGSIAASWANVLPWKGLTTKETREQWDEILDLALHDAGVRPLDKPSVLQAP